MSDSAIASYLAEVYFHRWASTYDADSFGETDTTTNQWKPIDASDLTFGTNGFYQKYAGTELSDSFTDSAEGNTVTSRYNGAIHIQLQLHKEFGTASAEFDGTVDALSIYYPLT